MFFLRDAIFEESDEYFFPPNRSSSVRVDKSVQVNLPEPTIVSPRASLSKAPTGSPSKGGGKGTCQRKSVKNDLQGISGDVNSPEGSVLEAPLVRTGQRRDKVCLELGGSSSSMTLLQSVLEGQLGSRMRRNYLSVCVQGRKSPRSLPPMGSFAGGRLSIRPVSPPPATARSPPIRKSPLGLPFKRRASSPRLHFQVDSLLIRELLIGALRSKGPLRGLLQTLASMKIHRDPSGTALVPMHRALIASNEAAGVANPPTYAPPKKEEEEIPQNPESTRMTQQNI